MRIALFTPDTVIPSVFVFIAHGAPLIEGDQWSAQSIYLIEQSHNIFNLPSLIVQHMKSIKFKLTRHIKKSRDRIDYEKRRLRHRTNASNPPLHPANPVNPVNPVSMLFGSILRFHFAVSYGNNHQSCQDEGVDRDV